VAATDQRSPLPVYVIHYHAPQWCAETVASLHAGTIPVDVTIIDNGGLPEAVEGARVVRSGQNLGFSGGANAALADWLQGESTWCLITSHDLRLAPDCLAVMLGVVGRSPGVGIAAPGLGQAGGRDLLPKHEPLLWHRRTRAVPFPRPQVEGAELCSWVSGSCLLIRRAMVDDIGPFDERYGSYAEDVDLCFRANQAGWDVVMVRGAEATTVGTASRGAATTLMVANGPFGAAKNLGPRVAVRGLSRNLARALVSAVRIVTGGRPSVEQARVAAARTRGWVLGLAKVVGWYGHVLGRRLRGQAPVDARCHEPSLGDHTRPPLARRQRST
jgi:N-acetylglucosaminyl-diphospho-decaprenol L-rhamnosyltransferase